MSEQQSLWDAMTDDERDAWIAEHVMGYETGLMPSGTMQMWDVSGICEDIPRYTRDLNAAWLVLQCMADEKRYYHYQQAFMRAFGNAATLGNDWDETGLTYTGLAALTPERICRAAWHALQETSL